MRNIGEYEVFKRSHKLTLEIYKITKKFPKEELYALFSKKGKSNKQLDLNLHFHCLNFLYWIIW